MATQSLPLFPLNTVLFPDSVLALRVFEARYLDMISQCIVDDSAFGVVLLTAGNEVAASAAHESLAEEGTIARITHWSAPEPGLLQVSCIGTHRFALVSSLCLPHGLWLGEAEPIASDQVVPVPPDLQDVSDALARLLAAIERGAGHGMPGAPPFRLDQCGWVANRWCELLPMPNEDKQRLLSINNALIRLELVQDMLIARGQLR